jgi:PPOX class probable F420-dependent enzyme
VDLEKAREFIRNHHRAVLATFRADGRLQMSPVAVAVDDAGRAVVSSRETAMKVKNLRRDPRMSLCVLSDEWYGEWVYVDGRAEIVSLPDAMEPLIDYYRRVAGEHPDWDDYRAAMERERRVVVRIELEHAGPDRSG